jgi:hypothetical protein
VKSTKKRGDDYCIAKKLLMGDAKTELKGVKE